MSGDYDGWMKVASQKLHNVVLRKHSNGEGSGPCPKCGGEDRFLVFEEGNAWCRQCNYKTWWKEEKKPTAEQVQQRKEVERTTQAKLLEQIQHCNLWMVYHDHPKAIEKWEETGIDQFSTHEWGLGYCESCPVKPDQDSLTIPVFFKGRLFSIRHRLLGECPDGKYRTYLTGLPPTFFNLDCVYKSQRVYVVEGEKKAIKLHSIGFAAVIGVPGKALFTRLPDLLNRHLKPTQEVVFLPDPDGVQEALASAKKINVTRKYIVDLWEKPDDFLETYGVGAFRKAISLPRPI